MTAPAMIAAVRMLCFLNAGDAVTATFVDCPEISREARFGAITRECR